MCPKVSAWTCVIVFEIVALYSHPQHRRHAPPDHLAAQLQTDVTLFLGKFFDIIASALESSFTNTHITIQRTSLSA